MKHFTVRMVQNEQELMALLYQRWLVLRKPLGMPQGTETDRYEEQSVHLIAVIPEGVKSSSAQGVEKIIGSARLRELSPSIGGISYVAVLPEFQNQGVGSALIQSLIALAKKQQFHQLKLRSRLSAAGFYEHFGFISQGAPIDYLGIPHILMSLIHQLQG